MTVSEVDDELETILAYDKASDADLADDEDDVAADGLDMGDSCDDSGM